MFVRVDRTVRIDRIVHHLSKQSHRFLLFSFYSFFDLQELILILMSKTMRSLTKRSSFFA